MQLNQLDRPVIVTTTDNLGALVGKEFPNRYELAMHILRTVMPEDVAKLAEQVQTNVAAVEAMALHLHLEWLEGVHAAVDKGVQNLRHLIAGHPDTPNV